MTGFGKCEAPRRHFLHSKLMAWLAVDRALKSADTPWVWDATVTSTLDSVPRAIFRETSGANSAHREKASIDVQGYNVSRTKKEGPMERPGGISSRRQIPFGENAMRISMICAVLLCSVLGCSKMFAQNVPPATAETACTFADGKQLSLRYSPVSGGGKEGPPMGEVWAPGGSAMNLFTQVGLSAGNSEIPIDAYSVYVIPDKKSWTLIINKGVVAGSKYDEHQDVLRVPMQIGRLSTKVDFEATFVHIAPKQCNLRIYYGKIGSWVEFKESDTPPHGGE